MFLEPRSLSLFVVGTTAVSWCCILCWLIYYEGKSRVGSCGSTVGLGLPADANDVWVGAMNSELSLVDFGDGACVGSNKGK